MTNLYAVELAELETHEREMEQSSGMIRSNVVIFGQHLSAIHESECWKAKYKNFDDYCETRWRFSGSRGRQLVSAYDVAKNLAAMTEENQLGTFLFEYFTESHARVLKDLSPDQQRTAWTAATASGEAPTAKTLSVVVDAIKTTPEDVYAMGKEEQHAFVTGLEQKAEEASVQHEAIAVASLAMKRLRAVAESIRDDKFGNRFNEGRYTIGGGISGLIAMLQTELKARHEEWTAPLLEAEMTSET